MLYYWPENIPEGSGEAEPPRQGDVPQARRNKGTTA